MPRLRGRGKHRINYRHVIDWLVRKPGAFEDYRYREDLFPTSRFRMAYDVLQETHGERAGKQYLEILDLAAQESEVGVDEALRNLLAGRAARDVLKRWKNLDCRGRDGDPAGDAGVRRDDGLGSVRQLAGRTRRCGMVASTDVKTTLTDCLRELAPADVPGELRGSWPGGPSRRR